MSYKNEGANNSLLVGILEQAPAVLEQLSYVRLLGEVLTEGEQLIASGVNPRTSAYYPVVFASTRGRAFLQHQLQRLGEMMVS